MGHWKVARRCHAPVARQKARWFGHDVFLASHGGDEYFYTMGRGEDRFTEEENPYSVYGKEGDILIWNDNQWRDPKEPGRIRPISSDGHKKNQRQGDELRAMGC